MEQKLTKQDIFNKVSEHLLTQKKKSAAGRRGTDGCLYINDKGLKCAIGALFTDDELCDIKSKGLNDRSVLRLPLPYRIADEVDFMRSIQLIHDTNKPSRWLGKLSSFAKKNGLDASVLDKFRKKKTEQVFDSNKRMTHQEIYDKVVVHLLTQKKKSMRVKGTIPYDPKLCAYRGENGLMCAVGCLITDKEYNSLNFSEQSSVYDIAESIERLHGYGSILGLFQEIHDTNKPSRWYEKLSAYGKKHGLNREVLFLFKKPRKK